MASHQDSCKEGLLCPQEEDSDASLPKKLAAAVHGSWEEWDGMGQGSPNGNEEWLLDAVRIHSGVRGCSLCNLRQRQKQIDRDWCRSLGTLQWLLTSFCCWWYVFVPWGLLSTTLRPLPEVGRPECWVTLWISPPSLGEVCVQRSIPLLPSGRVPRSLLRFLWSSGDYRWLLCFGFLQEVFRFSAWRDVLSCRLKSTCCTRAGLPRAGWGHLYRDSR